MKKTKFDIQEFLKEFRTYLLRKYTKKWKRTYIPFDLLNEFSEYKICISERTDGKTYIFLEMILYLFIKYGHSGVIIRRWETDIKGETGKKLIKNLIGQNEIVQERTNGKYNNAVEEISNGRYNSIIYQSRSYYLVRNYVDENGKQQREVNTEPFLDALALSQEEHNKGGGYENYKIILFDEFIARDSYMIDEFVSFMNTLSTIIRRRTDVVVFMCGNTINRYCPYFDEMGLKNVKNQKFGTIDTYIAKLEDKETHELLTCNIQIELVDYVTKEHKKSNKYFIFNNPKLQMITNGKWEMYIYPRKPEPFVPKDVVFKYFIIFDDETFMCEIVHTKTNDFTFIHPHTKKIDIKNDTLIFDLNAPISPHYRRKINKPYDDLGKAIANYYVRDKICYSSNAVGDTIHNYLECCISQ